MREYSPNNVSNENPNKKFKAEEYSLLKGLKYKNTIKDKWDPSSNHGTQTVKENCY